MKVDFDFCSLRKAGAPLAALLLLSCSGCGDECPSQPQCAAGAIEGYLTGGSGPLQGTVKAEAVSATGGVSGSFATDADSTGWYHLDLPGGSYVVWFWPDAEGSDRSCYASTGPVISPRGADTLRVLEGDQPLRVDCSLGGLRARVCLPADLEGRETHLSFATEDSTLWAGWHEIVRGVRAAVEQGVAEFTCPALVPGAYTMHLYAGTAEEIWLPAVRTPGDADAVTVAAGEMTEYETVVATSCARMTGEIVGSWQEMGLERPQVCLIGADSTAVAETDTDWLGNFAFELLIATRVRVLVDIESHTRWIGGRDFEEAQEFDLRSGEEISGVRFEESGLLLDIPAEDLLDAWGMLVEVVYADDLAPVLQAGYCGFLLSRLLPIPNLTPGDYLIHVSPWAFLDCGLLSQWYDRAESPEQAAVVSVQQEGEVVPITLHMERGGTIQGQVMWSRVEESEYPWVCATTATSEEHLGAIRPGAPWRWSPGEPFTLRGLPDGDYKVGGWVCGSAAPNCAPKDVTWYPGTANWDSAAVVGIRDHGDLSGIDFEIH